MINPLSGRGKMAQETYFETREEVQSYLLSLEGDLSVPLEDPAVAAELDRRDKLASFRERFEVPSIGELLDEGDRDPGIINMNAFLYECLSL